MKYLIVLFTLGLSFGGYAKSKCDVTAIGVELTRRFVDDPMFMDTLKGKYQTPELQCDFGKLDSYLNSIQAPSDGDEIKNISQLKKSLDKHFGEGTGALVEKIEGLESALIHLGGGRLIKDRAFTLKLISKLFDKKGTSGEDLYFGKNLKENKVSSFFDAAYLPHISPFDKEEPIMFVGALRSELKKCASSLADNLAEENCDIDKAFNNYSEALRKAGMGEDDLSHCQVIDKSKVEIENDQVTFVSENKCRGQCRLPFGFGLCQMRYRCTYKGKMAIEAEAFCHSSYCGSNGNSAHSAKACIADLGYNTHHMKGEIQDTKNINNFTRSKNESQSRQK